MLKKKFGCKHHKKTVASTLLISLIFIVLISSVSAAQPEAAIAISEAQNTIISCYDAATEAETAGANITFLLETLNEASGLLSNAELAYSVNDFDTAQNLAQESQNKLSNFINDANILREAAVQKRTQGFLINVIGPIIGAVVVAIICSLIWVLLKRKYEPTRTTPTQPL